MPETLTPYTIVEPGRDENGGRIYREIERGGARPELRPVEPTDAAPAERRSAPETHAPDAAVVREPATKKRPRIERWVGVPDWEGYRCRIWVNFDQRTKLDLSSGEAERVTAAMRRIVLEHDGWPDEDERVLPPADSDEFWAYVTGDDALLAAISWAIAGARADVPKSGLPSALRSRLT